MGLVKCGRYKACYAKGSFAGVMRPELLEDGQVCVDMGPPTLDAARVPTTLPPTQVGNQDFVTCVLCILRLSRA